MTAKLRTIGRKVAPSQRAKVRVAEKTADAFYVSLAWRTLCAELKKNRWPRLLATQGHCCEDPHCTATHSRTTRIFFDHIQERRADAECGH